MRMTRKMAVLIGALVLVLGGIVSCDNWMVESLLKKKPTAVSGIRVEPKTLSGGIGAPYEIKAIVEPENATDKGIIWTSNNDRVATVSNGLVVFQAVGTAIITAMTRDGNFTDYCTVEVKRTISMSSSLMGEVGGMLSLSVSIPGDEGIADFNLESNKADVVAINPDKTLSLLDVGEATIKVTVTDNTIDPAYCLVKVVEAGNLAIRFGATDTGKTGADLVTETFQRIHAYLNDPSTSWDLPRIHLGNFIDLPGLVVSADNGGGGQINLSAPPNSKVLRLIVVGINSFNKGTTGSPSYEGGVDTPVRHIVMQFNDCPGTHRMNQDPTNVGGYLGSEMRKYLRGENGGDITFPIGLENAGVPLNDNDIIFAPRRYVWKGYDEFGAAIITYPQCDTISGDKLWLPTEIEMFGTNSSSNGYETGFNQTRLMYYDGPNSKRLKAASTSTTISVWYWEASPRKNPDGFCRVLQGSGTADGYHADGTGGLAPAFCVK
ncbi:MAG: Ig-like domain-containing protein [Spirochaetaceae bacterium]|jgi:hypothetical protein|nr:Ig-like domain-containing protein [Spirochaetaceae bacterium]